MLQYVRKLTLTPAQVDKSDIERLRRAGFGDEAIGDIALTAAIYAMMNRVVDGLGDNLPRGMEREADRLGLLRIHQA
jgi:alkylhydroperoxidase family enzyme